MIVGKIESCHQIDEAKQTSQQKEAAKAKSTDQHSLSAPGRDGSQKLPEHLEEAREHVLRSFLRMDPNVKTTDNFLSLGRKQHDQVSLPVSLSSDDMKYMMVGNVI